MGASDDSGGRIAGNCYEVFDVCFSAFAAIVGAASFSSFHSLIRFAFACPATIPLRSRRFVPGFHILEFQRRCVCVIVCL